MSPTQLLAYFDRIAEAPGAVARLRGFILDLAVRGKLVDQDLRDEPARLNGRSSDASFPLPSHWANATLGEFLDLQYGKALPRGRTESDGPVPVFGSNGVVGRTTETLAQEPAIIIGRKGSAGALNLCDGPSWTTDVAYFVIPPPFLSIRFLLFALKTLDLDKLGKGVKPGLSRSDVYSLSLAVPPLAEQHRIIGKVDELTALCDRLEAAQAKRESRRERLAAASLASLTVSHSHPAILNTHARFALDNFAAFTRRQDQIRQLRQTILNLAVRGKLVPQNVHDEPASELLNEIARKRKRLYAEKRIRKPKGLPPMDESDFPFAIPAGWSWSMLGDLCYQVSDGPHFSPQYVAREQGVPFLSTRNVRPEGFDLTSLKYVSRADHEEFCRRVRPERDDIIYTKGGTTGIAKVNDLDFEFSVWVHLAVLRIEKERLYPRYVEAALNSAHCYEQSQRYTQGISNFDLGLTRMIKITIPIPPLAEQARIVSRVQELMALCDRLEAALASAQHARSRLLETVLRKALDHGTTKPETLPAVAH